MHDAWIVPSKLVPPEPARPLLERDCLAEPLPPVVLVTGGPGDGKSQALLAIAGRSPVKDERVLWVRLDEDDVDAATFFAYLVAGMRQHVPDFGADLLTRLSGQGIAPKALWSAFWREVAHYNLPGLCLVLDDAQHLEGAGDLLLASLGACFEKLPPRVRVLVASRRPPAMPIARLRAQGRVATIEATRLRFSASEVARYLALRGVPAAPWLSDLDGWPLGLAMVTGEPSGSFEGTASSGDLAAYITEEIFSTRPPASQAWMLRLAMLDEVTLEIAQALDAGADAAAGIADLQAAQLLQRTADGAAWRFPTYLRDYLRAEAAKRFDADTRAAGHRAAARFYAANARPERAISHFVAAGDWDEAATAMLRCFPSMRFAGRQALIGRLLAGMPAEVLATRPALRVWQGHLQGREGDVEGAIASYRAAREGFHARGDATGEFKALVRLCSISVSQDDPAASGPLMFEALALQHAGEDEDRADFFLARAMLADRRGDLDLVRECNEAVLEVPIADNPEIGASHCVARMNLYTAALNRGDLEGARAHLDAGLTAAEQGGCLPYHAFMSFLAAHLALLVGDLDGAGAHLSALPDGWEELLNWVNVALGRTILGHYHQVRGEWERADTLLERARSTFERAGFQEALKIPLERMLWGALTRRQARRLAAMLDGLGEPDARSIYDLALAIPVGRERQLLGEPALAAASLAATVTELDRLEARLHATRARLYLAAARSEAGETEAAREALAAAEAAIQTHGYGFLRGEDSALWAELQALAVEPLQLVHRVPAAGFELTLLGGFEVRSGGLRIEHWPRRKSRLVLAALALYPRGLRPAELAELCGEPGMTLATLQRNVSGIRQALEAAGDSATLVVLEDDRYRLDGARVAGVDVWTLEAAIAEARQTSAENAEAAYTRALGLYRAPLWEDGPAEACFVAERERLRALALGAARWLESRRRTAGDWEGALAMLERAVAIAPTDEELYLALIAHHRAAGQLERARQAYWDCRKALKLHLGLEPGEAIEAAHSNLENRSARTR